MKTLLTTDASKGTIAILAACLLFAFPPLLNWTVAVAALTVGIRHIRQSFCTPEGVVVRCKPKCEHVDVSAALTQMHRGERLTPRGISHQPVIIDVQTGDPAKAVSLRAS